MLSKKTDLQALQLEAEALASFLRTELRTFSKQHRPVELEPDAPAAAAVLWKAVGWSAVFEKSELVAPERDTGEARIERRLEDYRSWDDGFTLTGSELPAKRRLVMDDGQGVGFVVTDERADEVDAPTLAVLADTNKVAPESKSYTRFCAHTMAACAFRRMYQTEIEIRPAGALVAAATKPWPLLIPGARQLSADLYCEPPSADAAQPHTKGKYKLAHRSVEALLTFLQTLEFEALALYPPGDSLHLPAKLAAFARDADQMRPLPSLKEAEAYFVGTLGGVLVLVREEATRSRAYTNPRRLADLQAVIDARTQR